MKNIYILALMMFLASFTIYSQTIASRKIVIENFEDRNFSKYQGSTEEITKNISEGFELHILKNLSVDKVFYKNAAGGEVPQSISSSNETVDIYTIQGIPPVNNICTIIIHKGTEPRTITLKVKPEAEENDPPLKGNTDCNPVLFKHKQNCPALFPESFGLDPNDFDKDDVIYVYDFNKVTSKRRMYKLTKDKYGDTAFKVEKKANLTKETLNAHKQVWIKVANINRFMYDVSVADSLFYYNSKPSALFNRMFIGDSLSTLGTLMDASVIQSKDKQDKVTEILGDLDCFNQMYTSLKVEMIKAFDPCETFACCNEVDFKAISLKLNKIRTSISLLQLEFTDSKKALEALKKEKTDCEALIKDEKKLRDELEKLKVGDAGYDAAKTKVDNLENCKKDATGRQDKIDTAEKELAVMNGLSEIKSSLPTDSHLKQLSVFLLNMVEQNQALIRGPIQLDGNLLDVTINIASRDSIVKKFGYPDFQDKIHFTIPVLGRSFVNFSSGSFAAIGRNLQEKTYSWQEISNSSGYTLAESGYTNPAAGFSAFASVEWKTGRSLGWGPTIGVGITIEETPKLAYLAGVSVFIGDKHQFAVTAGLAFMQVNRLSKNFLDAAANQIVYDETRDLDYYKEFKIGAFISLSYTVFNLSKNK